MIISLTHDVPYAVMIGFLGGAGNYLYGKHVITLTILICMIIHKIINHNLRLHCLSGYKMECLSS